MKIVADTGPIIGLAKIGRISLLKDLASEVLIPPIVHKELYGRIEVESEQIDQAFKNLEDSNFGDVMVVGGGISGIQASLDLADSGYRVYLVEKSPAIGGKMAQLDKTYPTNDCSM